MAPFASGARGPPLDTVKILGLVLARAGSKSVPRKNIRQLAGRPMLAYTIEEALKSKRIDRLLLSTESPEIAALGRDLGAETPFLRPAALAEDLVQDLPVVLHCLDWLRNEEGEEPLVLVHLRPTSPLRRAEHIDAAVDLLLEHPDADSVRSVCVAPAHPLKMWRLGEDYLEPFVPSEVYGITQAFNRPRQSLPSAYIQNGAVDVVWTRTIRTLDSMSGSRILAFVMDERDSTNVDSEIDFQVAEHILLLTRGFTQ